MKFLRLHQRFYMLLVISTVSLAFTIFYYIYCCSAVRTVSFDFKLMDSIHEPPKLFTSLNTQQFKFDNLNSSTHSVIHSKPSISNNTRLDRPISCSSLFNGNEEELKRSFEYLERHPKIAVTAVEYSSQMLRPDFEKTLRPMAHESRGGRISYCLLDSNVPRCGTIRATSSVRLPAAKPHLCSHRPQSPRSYVESGQPHCRLFEWSVQ